MKDAAPEAMIQRIEQYFRVPAHVADQIRNTVEKVHGGYALLETRPPWRENDDLWTKMPVAKMVFNAPSQRWKLYWRRASGRWALYSQYKDISGVLRAIKTDRYGCFWG